MATMINVQFSVDSETLRMIDQAAENAGTTRDDLFRAMCRAEAERAVLDTVSFKVDAASESAWAELLGRPLTENSRVRKLLARVPLWQQK